MEEANFGKNRNRLSRALLELDVFEWIGRDKNAHRSTDYVLQIPPVRYVYDERGNVLGKHEDQTSPTKGEAEIFENERKRERGATWNFIRVEEEDEYEEMASVASNGRIVNAEEIP